MTTLLRLNIWLLDQAVDACLLLQQVFDSVSLLDAAYRLVCRRELLHRRLQELLQERAQERRVQCFLHPPLLCRLGRHSFRARDKLPFAVCARCGLARYVERV